MSGAMLGRWAVDAVHCVDALELLRGLPDASVDLIATDPPFNIGKAAWDSWATLDDYLAWLDEHLREFKRVLKPNGSLYLFCATQYQAEVHVTVNRHLNVLNNIRWRKENGWHKKAAEEDARAYFPASETVIFAEQFGADANAVQANDGLRGFLFEPLRAYLDGERRRAGIGFEAVRLMVGCASGSGLPSHWFTSSQWILPTAEQYAKLQRGFNARGGEYLRAEYEELRAKYEELRAEYEYLRRPFFATDSALNTDIWDFATVAPYAGKHPCEKPLDMCRHIVTVSSRPGALVLDPFCGSGNMLRAAWLEGRRYIGGDSDDYWVRRASDALRLPFEPRRVKAENDLSGLPLFAAADADV